MPYWMYIDKGKVMNSVWRGAILTSLTKHTYEKTNQFIFILPFPKVFMNIKLNTNIFLCHFSNITTSGTTSLDKNFSYFWRKMCLQWCRWMDKKIFWAQLCTPPAVFCNMLHNDTLCKVGWEISECVLHNYWNQRNQTFSVSSIFWSIRSDGESNHSHTYYLPMWKKFDPMPEKV